jgi:predicted PurR-regulated permease PerM
MQQAAADLKHAADGAPPAIPRGVTRVAVEEPGFRLTDLLWRGSLGAIEAIGQATIVGFFVFYLLAFGDLYKRKLVRIAGPSMEKRRLSVEILEDISRQIERFLMVRVIISLIVGVTTWVTFWSLGVAQPVMWGIAAGVLNTVPYVGPCAVIAAAGVAGLMQFGNAGMSALLAGTCLLIASLEGLIITPWLMSRAGRMNAGMIFVSLSFWGWIWGMWGLLLAVPIMMVIKTVSERVDGWHAISAVLDE